jgi:hypothetical protein
MDPLRFDNLTRALSAPGSRRAAVASLLGAVGSLLVPGDPLLGNKARAKKGGKKGKKNKKDKEKLPTPRPLCNGIPCFGEEKCCGNTVCCPKGTGCEFSLEAGYFCCAPERACGDGCCPAGTTCCPSQNAGHQCCDAGAICHPGVGDLRPACCAPGRTPCGGGCCVNPSGHCNSLAPTCCKSTGPDPAPFFYCCAGGLDCKPSGGTRAREERVDDCRRTGMATVDFDALTWTADVTSAPPDEPLWPIRGDQS